MWTHTTHTTILKFLVNKSCWEKEKGRQAFPRCVPYTN